MQFRHNLKSIATFSCVAVLVSGGGVAVAAAAHTGSGDSMAGMAMPAAKADAPTTSAASPKAKAAKGSRAKHAHRARVPFAKAIATYLGIEPKALRTDLKAGKSLADVATAHGRTTDGLESAIVAAAKQRTAKAVAAGRIAQAVADQRVAKLSKRLDTLVDRDFSKALTRATGCGTAATTKAAGGTAKTSVDSAKTSAA